MQKLSVLIIIVTVLFGATAARANERDALESYVSDVATELARELIAEKRAQERNAGYRDPQPVASSENAMRSYAEVKARIEQLFTLSPQKRLDDLTYLGPSYATLFAGLFDITLTHGHIAPVLTTLGLSVVHMALYQHVEAYARLVEPGREYYLRRFFRTLRRDLARGGIEFAIPWSRRNDFEYLEGQLGELVGLEPMEVCEALLREEYPFVKQRIDATSGTTEERVRVAPEVAPEAAHEELEAEAERAASGNGAAARGRR